MWGDAACCGPETEVVGIGLLLVAGRGRLGCQRWRGRPRHPPAGRARWPSLCGAIKGGGKQVGKRRWDTAPRP